MLIYLLFDYYFFCQGIYVVYLDVCYVLIKVCVFIDFLCL